MAQVEGQVSSARNVGPTSACGRVIRRIRAHHDPWSVPHTKVPSDDLTVGNTKEMPWVGDALQSVRTTILKDEASAGNQVLDSARDEYFAGLGKRQHARCRVHGHPAHSRAAPFDFTCVATHSDTKAQRRHRGMHLLTALHRARRAIERGEEAVAGGIHLLAAESSKERANHAIVFLKQLCPTPVSDN